MILSREQTCYLPVHKMVAKTDEANALISMDEDGNSLSHWM